MNDELAAKLDELEMLLVAAHARSGSPEHVYLLLKQALLVLPSVRLLANVQSPADTAEG